MTPPALRSSGLTSEYLEQVIEECDQLYSEARDSDVSVRDRAGILATKALASTRLGKQRGEDQASMRKFMMTREWRAIEAALECLIEHCSKVAPDACKDFRTALEQIEGDDKGP